MIIDSSALVAILRNEPDAEYFTEAIEAAAVRRLSAANFGDCFAYALAKVSGEGLLHKGNDFSQTDLASEERNG